MKVILDECLPKRLKSQFPERDVTTVPMEGLAGVSNGKLLDAIQERFDVFLTIDGSLEYQQKFKDRPIMVIVIRSVSNRFEDLLPLIPAIKKALEHIQPGTVIRVG